MGGMGSGPPSVKARAFDLYDFGLNLLTYLKHHLQDPDARPLTEDLLQERSDDLDLLAKRLKKAIEDERPNGK